MWAPLLAGLSRLFGTRVGQWILGVGILGPEFRCSGIRRYAVA